MQQLVYRETIGTTALDDWGQEFHNLYSAQEGRRSEAESWLQAVQHAGVVAEAIRLEKYGDCLEHLARVFCSLSSFVAKCRSEVEVSPFKIERSFSEIVFEKYPGHCPACGAQRCMCPVNRYQSQEGSPYGGKAPLDSPPTRPNLNVVSNPTTLEGFLQMFNRLYGDIHGGLPVEVLALHFLEEIGEVSNAIRVLAGRREMNAVISLEWELADVFSWTCNLFLRLRQHLGVVQWLAGRLSSGMERAYAPIELPSFSSIVWTVYAGDGEQIRCPSCGARPCMEEVPEPEAKSGSNWHVGVGREGVLVIAIDGPSGAGKSTVARKLAERLGLSNIESGATYRAAALKVLESDVPVDDEEAVTRLISEADIRVGSNGVDPRVFLDGRDVTTTIRSPEVTLAAARVSRVAGVRKRLISVQRSFARPPGVVMEGRDIGTVVFPQAQLKIFLKADVEERARRRLKQDSRQGRDATLEKTAYEIGRRDQLDAERKISPLTPASDAVEIDSTHLQAEQVVEQILDLVKKRGLGEPGRAGGEK